MPSSRRPAGGPSPLRFPIQRLKLARCSPAHLNSLRAQLARCFPRSFTFYVAFPESSIRPLGFPIYVVRIPAAPFAGVDDVTIQPITRRRALSLYSAAQRPIEGSIRRFADM